jgi:hypothetical protein
MLTIKKIFITAILLTTITAVYATTEQYIEAMKKNIDLVYKATSISELQTAINGFQRIVSVEKNKWEPHYYAAFGHIMIATRDTVADRRDQALDMALEYLTKASEINAGESEIVALQGFVHLIRVSINPASRGSQFAGLAVQYFQAALRLNADNPRALALLAQMQFGTAKFFGSSTEEACTTTATALLKFDTFKSENPLAPQWGKSMTEKLKANCN